MKITGGDDVDFSLSDDFRLLVSIRALQLMQTFSIKGCDIEEVSRAQ